MFDSVLDLFDRRRDRDSGRGARSLLGLLGDDDDHDERRPYDRRRFDQHDDDWDEDRYRLDRSERHAFDWD